MTSVLILRIGLSMQSATFLLTDDHGSRWSYAMTRAAINSRTREGFEPMSTLIFRAGLRRVGGYRAER